MRHERAKRIELNQKKCKPAILLNCLHSANIVIRTFVLNITFWALKHTRVHFSISFIKEEISTDMANDPTVLL